MGLGPSSLVKTKMPTDVKFTFTPNIIIAFCFKSVKKNLSEELF